MRLVLMGTGPFAVPSFEALRAGSHEICAVITRPEAAGSNKKAPPPSPVRLWAENHRLARFSPDSLNTEESIAWLISLQADLFVVCDYGQILSSTCLAASRLGGINLHGSLLPRHRGAAPVQWSILSGDKLAGVTVIHMTPGLDAGPMLGQDSVEISSRETAAELESRLSQLGVATVQRSLGILVQGMEVTQGIEQDAHLATKAPRLSKSDGQINVRDPIRFLDRQCRGLYPWPGCYCELEQPNGSRVRVIFHRGFPYESRIENLSPGEIVMGPELQNVVPRELLGASNLGIVVLDGIYCVELIQPAGKRVMSSEEFARGYQRQGRLTVVPVDGRSKLIEKMMKMEGKT